MVNKNAMAKIIEPSEKQDRFPPHSHSIIMDRA
jgi:hypothetical protein